MNRSTYNKMKYSNFHLLIGILEGFMLYQNADDNLSYPRYCSLHSLVKLFAGWARPGKTCKEIKNEAESYSSISVKTALFGFNCILFKIFPIKNIPKPHSDAFKA